MTQARTGSDRNPDDRDVISKSQRKREAKALLDFGRRLVELPEPVLRSLPLEEHLLQEVLYTRAITARVARKRQLGFLAKQLRGAELEPVVAALDARHDAARQLTARQHRVEAWRDRLLEGDRSALGHLLDARRDLDAQTLRQLLRNARRESDAGKPPAAARKLFRLLRDHDETAALPPLP
ncbi:MAG: ribosome biogenesis factor YjgA [Pseudomonadota bacterium]